MIITNLERVRAVKKFPRFPSNPILISVPFSSCSDLMRRPQNKKGKRVLLGLGSHPLVMVTILGPL